MARYVRLFNILFYASVTPQFAPLQSPHGLDALIDLGALTADEKDGLLASAQMQHEVACLAICAMPPASSDAMVATEVHTTTLPDLPAVAACGG